MNENPKITNELWTKVDNYFVDLYTTRDTALDAALEDSRNAGLPDISITASQGQFLHMLARLQRAKAILEIGTLGGYSTIWLARALEPGGRVTTLELNPRHAEIAAANILRAGVSDRVDIRIGPALETLAGLTGPFDLVFIDADKPNYPDYLESSIRLGREGTVIVADNVARKGAIIEAGSSAPDVQGMRRFHERLASDTRVVASAIQTVSAKGYDGLAIAVVQPR
jgi:predicted O-methyltransferase YrrM